jgi:anti-sigma B factor antagonist
MSVLTVDVHPGSLSEITVLALHGPLLIAHVPVFQQATQRATTTVTVIDFSGCSYMDSAGLGALLQFYRQVMTQQRRLVVVGLNQRVDALLKLTRADSLLEIKPTLDDVEKAPV